MLYLRWRVRLPYGVSVDDLLGAYDTAFQWLALAADDAIAYHARGGDASASPFSLGGLQGFVPATAAAETLESLASARWNPLRADPRFAEIEARLRSCAK